MATTQYIGARYVPLFAEPAEWDSTKQYEPLTIVIHEGNSYTSKQYVPVGIEITNEKFWALTGNYNAQVEQYRKELRNVLPYDETPTEGSTKGVTSDGIKKAIDTAEQANATAITNEVTRARGAEEVNATAIANEVTRAKEAEQTNATAITNEVTRAKEAEQSNADTIQNLGFTNPLYGVCRIADKNTWKYVATYDFESIGTIGNLPSRNATLDYSDASNLFERNGILYYPQDAHRDIYATRDGETWESGYGINYPSPLGDGYSQWAPMLFEDENNNVKMAMARQYNSDSVPNSAPANTHNFRIDVFDCTVDSAGRINISNTFTTVLSDGTHIDPYIVYTKSYGYIMACKDEKTCQIELYSGNELTNMTRKVILPCICCEAPKFFIHNNDIALITHAYILRSGNPTNTGSALGNFYLSTHIDANTFAYSDMNVISCPHDYRHIAFIMNSKVLSKYARKHGIIPYASKTDTLVHVDEAKSQDIYPAMLPMKIVFRIMGSQRTIKIHNVPKGSRGMKGGGINYIVGGTDHQPTITNEDNTYTHVIKDGEVFPIYIWSDGRVLFS